MSHRYHLIAKPRLPDALNKPSFLARQRDQQPFSWIRLDAAEHGREQPAKPVAQPEPQHH
ncbi:hypothetical protein [Chitinolyticbacter meiyuanensis]|uniref:hypothetical protein n=1 Tax=Chitinolyticbacter meiyuanensis TaxID=682798 RepID=UPI0011E5B059|nr:hypothetical protein [Chitinolyticbacter meiyuanensis]